MDTKEKLILTALRYFVSEGYEKTSLSAIAQIVGISKPAIYYYYKSKDELFLDAVQYFFSYLEQWTGHLFSSGLPIEKIIEGLFCSVKEVQTQMKEMTGELGMTPNHYKVIFDAVKKFSHLQETIHTMYTGMESLLACRIAEGQKNKTVRADVDAEALAFELIAAVEGMYLMSMFYPAETVYERGEKVYKNIWKRIKA